MEDLLLRILPFLSNHGVVLSNLDGDILNNKSSIIFQSPIIYTLEDSR